MDFSSRKALQTERDFLITEIRIGLTFAMMAKQHVRQEDADQSQAHALKVYKTARRLISLTPALAEGGNVMPLMEELATKLKGLGVEISE